MKPAEIHAISMPIANPMDCGGEAGRDHANLAGFVLD